MKNKNYERFDYVEMKKNHACGTNSWQIIRVGMDIRIQCQGCEHIVTMVRRDFDNRVRQVIKQEEYESK